LKANTPPFEITGQRWVKSSTPLPAAALDEYFKGPGAYEKTYYGYIAIYNGFTGYSKIEFHDGGAYVYLKGACLGNGSDYTIADLINANMKQFPNVSFVKIYDQFGQTRNPDGQSDSEPLCLDPSFTPSPTPSVTPTFTRTPTITPTPTNTKPPSPTPLYVKVNVYFVDTKKYNAGTPPYEAAGVRWAKSDANFPKVVLDEYFKGPGYTEKYTYHWIAIYSGATGYSKFEVADGIARVYLTGNCNSQGATYTIGDVLKVNLKQFSSIQYVKIYDQNGSTEAPDGPSDSIPACLEP
jgi:Fe-S cluster biogenesis protein NfuA